MQLCLRLFNVLLSTLIDFGRSPVGVLKRENLFGRSPVGVLKRENLWDPIDLEFLSQRCLFGRVIEDNL